MTSPDFGTITNFSREGRDLNEDVWKVCMYVYDVDNTTWVRWDGTIDTVVNGDLIVAVDDLEEYVLDQQQNFKFVGHIAIGSITYVGTQNKAGGWIITKYDLSTANQSTVTYSTGSTPMPAIGNWASQSFDTYENTF